MTEKRFREVVSIKTIKDNQTGIAYTPCLVHDDFLELVNNLAEENEQLKSEINMLKNTIGRNEAFIKRITSNGEWNNTSIKQGDGG